MYKRYVICVLAMIAAPAYAASTCSALSGVEKFPPLHVRDGAICFVSEPVLDDNTGLPIGADAISLYYVPDGSAPVKAVGRGLHYDDTPGKVVDAFVENVGNRYGERVFIIHSLEVRNSLSEPNSSGNFYSVGVFNLTEHVLRRDERASDWFGAGYSWLSDGPRVVYRFPYRSRRDIQCALNSPFASLIGDDQDVWATIGRKVSLFDAPSVRDRTRKYLVAGDRVKITRITAGWCRVNYFGNVKPLEMWLTCSALDAEDRSLSFEFSS